MALQRAQLAANRVDVVYWGGLRPPRWNTSPVVRVSMGMLSGLLAVQQAAQALISGDVSTALATNRREVFVLASAEAVGQYNLAPSAQIIGRFLYPNLKEALRRGFKRLEITPDEVDLVALAGFSDGQGMSLPFDPSKMSIRQENPALIPLLKELEKRRLNYGLLLAVDENETTCGVLLERI